MTPRYRTITISKPDLSYALTACGPSVLDGVGNALFLKLWKELQGAQGKCAWDKDIRKRSRRRSDL